ncbi:uncharacterized protein LOC131183237 [Hevea brasiliensis]|uniref:uncharacterized protein LOC131183237 n=1 Tax=Hevea brasiliensis TaxID=3981 RepID=UPI0025DE202E|nr:uncharacterized protein LOC131183237 [Hevea brasiliensis]
MTRKAVKGIVIADLLVENPINDYEPLDFEFPNEYINAVGDDAEGPNDVWEMYFDGVVNLAGNGIGAALVAPDGRHFPIAVKLRFSYTNNVAEYKACVSGLQAAIEMKIKKLEVYGDSALIIYQVKGEWQTKDPKLIPYQKYLLELIKEFEEISFTHLSQDKNQFADALAILAVTTHTEEGQITQLLQIKAKSEPAYCLMIEEQIDGKPCGEILYKRSSNGELLRCVNAKEAKRILFETHEGNYATHSNGYMMINVPLHQLYNLVSPWPFAMWGIDVIGPINPKASNGYRFILVTIDYFTKWVEATSYAHITQNTFLKFFKNNMIHRYSLPGEIVTDNAKNLNGLKIQKLCDQYKTRHLNSSPYRTQMNGAVEAANKNLKRIIEKMIVTYKDWHDMLPFALHAYRTTVQTSTGATPYSLVYRIEAVLPIEVEIPSLRILKEAELDETEWVQSRLD